MYRLSKKKMISFRKTTFCFEEEGKSVCIYIIMTRLFYQVNYHTGKWYIVAILLVEQLY